MGGIAFSLMGRASPMTGSMPAASTHGREEQGRHRRPAPAHREAPAGARGPGADGNGAASPTSRPSCRVDAVAAPGLAVASGREGRGHQAQVGALVVRVALEDPEVVAGRAIRVAARPPRRQAAGSRRCRGLGLLAHADRQSSYGSSSRKSPPYSLSAPLERGAVATWSLPRASRSASPARHEEPLDVELDVLEVEPRPPACRRRRTSPPRSASRGRGRTGPSPSATDRRLASGSGSSSGQRSSNSVSRVVGRPRRDTRILEQVARLLRLPRGRRYRLAVAQDAEPAERADLERRAGGTVGDSTSSVASFAGPRAPTSGRSARRPRRRPAPGHPRRWRRGSAGCARSRRGCWPRSRPRRHARPAARPRPGCRPSGPGSRDRPRSPAGPGGRRPRSSPRARADGRRLARRAGCRSVFAAQEDRQGRHVPPKRHALGRQLAGAVRLVEDDALTRPTSAGARASASPAPRAARIALSNANRARSGSPRSRWRLPSRTSG